MTQSPVFMNRGDDPEMDQASQAARQTFRYFYRELCWERQRIIPALNMAAVKSAFRDPPELHSGDEVPEAEHMWISDVVFDGQFVSGELLNQPNWLKSVKQGDQVRIRPKEVTDWMVVIAGRAYGAYTVNLMRKRMSRGERKGHDGAWGLDFGDPEVIHVVPPDMYGNKASFFGKILGGSLPPIPASELESREHPMAEAMVQSLVEFLTKSPEQLTEFDYMGFAMIHRMSLAGSVACVTALLKQGANPNMLAKNGMTPLKLAQALGWKRVAEVLVKAGAK